MGDVRMPDWTWCAALAQCNPGRTDLSFRRTACGWIVEYSGDPPVMPTRDPWATSEKAKP